MVLVIQIGPFSFWITIGPACWRSAWVRHRVFLLEDCGRSRRWLLSSHCTLACMFPIEEFSLHNSWRICSSLWKLQSWEFLPAKTRSLTIFLGSAGALSSALFIVDFIIRTIRYFNVNARKASTSSLYVEWHGLLQYYSEPFGYSKRSNQWDLLKRIAGHLVRPDKFKYHSNHLVFQPFTFKIFLLHVTTNTGAMSLLVIV